MVYFSFLPASSPGCVVSSGSSTWSNNNCPADLAIAIKEAHARNEEILSVSVANDGDWFFSTNSFNKKKSWNNPMESRVLRFCNLATAQTGHETGLGNIAWITFTPDGRGFIGIVGHNGVAHCISEKLPKTLDDHLKTHKIGAQMKMVSIGCDNSWAIVYQDGATTVMGTCASLNEKLNNIPAVGYDVESIILSPCTKSNWIVTYENGASHYNLPYALAAGVDEQIRLYQQNLALQLQQLRQMNAMNNEAMMRALKANLEADALRSRMMAQGMASTFSALG